MFGKEYGQIAEVTHLRDFISSRLITELVRQQVKIAMDDVISKNTFKQERHAINRGAITNVIISNRKRQVTVSNSYVVQSKPLKIISFNLHQMYSI